MSERIQFFGKRHELKKSSNELTYKVEQRPGGWAIVETLKDGKPVSRKRVFFKEMKQKFALSLGGVLFSGEVQKVSHASTATEGGGDSDLIAQFPGKVRKLLTQEGAQVKTGEPLLLVEAMKMEFTVKAPSNGKIKKVLVKEGQQLSPGDRFFDFETEVDSK